jgi:hypothetical protein
MSDSATPSPYEEWRAGTDRAEDAAYVFGYYLMQHCRAAALKVGKPGELPASSEELQAHVAEAVDIALFNVMDLLEGFFHTKAGPNHTAEFALSVCVRDANDAEIERIDISPCLLDLQVGYWKWKDGEFR